MAIIVDKVQKKKDIAFSCKTLFIEKGFSNVTIAEVAKTAGVGKGTIYEYFNNKEEIVLEIARSLMQKNDEKLHYELSKLECTKDKIKKFSEFFYDEGDAELREYYKNFVSLHLVNPNLDMLTFQKEANNHYFQQFSKIIEEGIEKGELISESKDLIYGIYVTGKGMFINGIMVDSLDSLKEELDRYIDTIFALLEVKS